MFSVHRNCFRASGSAQIHIHGHGNNTDSRIVLEVGILHGHLQILQSKVTIFFLESPIVTLNLTQS